MQKNSHDVIENELQAEKVLNEDSTNIRTRVNTLPEEMQIDTQSTTAEDLSEKNTDSDLAKFRCQLCPKGFKHPTSLTLHKDSHAGKTQCPLGRGGTREGGGGRTGCAQYARAPRNSRRKRIQSRLLCKTPRDGAMGVLIGGGGGSRDAGVPACRLNKARMCAALRRCRRLRHRRWADA
ncbi:unnamed protein product, partial [Iphiclides podalirius]